MSVVICLAAAVILGGVVVVAMGRGGELARDRPELPVHSDFRSWSDVANYRPPAALLGYHARATEHALSLIARTIAERDAEIEWLRRRLAEARPESAPGPHQDPGAAAAPSSGELGPADQRKAPGRDGWQASPGIWPAGYQKVSDSAAAGAPDPDPGAVRAAWPAQQGLGRPGGPEE